MINSARNENDVEVCSICLEEWTNSGQHRLVSTQCGHLFGKMYKNNAFIFVLNYRGLNFRCIEKWLRRTPNCPQCQSFTKRRDLRRIYCRAIQALDTSERDNAIRERDLYT